MKSEERPCLTVITGCDTGIGAVFEEVGASFVAGGNRGLAPGVAARMMADRVARKRPHARYIVTKSPILSAIETLLPDRILDFLIAFVFKTARR